MNRALRLILAYGLLLFLLNSAGAQQASLSGTITISGAWAIYPTVVAWAEAFRKLHPGVKIDVSAGGAGKGAADAIAGLADIGMVSRDPDPAELSRGVQAVRVLHDAVFPVISEKNPALKELLKKGVKKETWVGMYITGSVTTWGEIVGATGGKPVHVYTRSDSCGASACWAKYLGNKKQEDLRGVGVYADPGLLDAARRDPIGIGYSNFSYVFTREGGVVKGAKLVPIDSNENGIADPDEIYHTRDVAIQAIKNGRYPATRQNFFFVKQKPGQLVKEFIAFALSEAGTKIVDEVGTSLPLDAADREAVLRGLGPK